MATQRELAKYLDTSEHVIRDLTKQDILPKRGRGDYDRDACRVEYIRYLRQMARDGRKKGATTPDEDQVERLKTQDTLATEKARLAAEQANKAAMENAIRRRELVPVQLLTDYAARIGNHVRANLEALPANLKRRIVHLRAADVNIVKQEVTKISDGLASFDIDDQDAA